MAKLTDKNKMFDEKSQIKKKKEKKQTQKTLAEKKKIHKTREKMNG